MEYGLKEDLEDILDATGTVWRDLKGARLFITGGTGFIGCWLLESLVYADRRLKLGLNATVLTRDPDAFRQKAPHLVDSSAIQLLKGNVLELPEVPGSYSHVIHAATEASAQLLRSDPLCMFDTIVLGTRNILDWASATSAERVLFTSSGAVYGRQPWELERIPDDWIGAPDCSSPLAAYAEGKRAAENLCSIFSEQRGLPVAIARCFAFVGPYLPLDIHFAIGNFIRDAMAGGPVIVNGDGTPYRSYLYASDLTVWLWHLLVRGTPALPVNVGSEESVTITELAACVARTLGDVGYRILGTPKDGDRPERYVPATERARLSLKLEQRISMVEGIRRTARWHGYRG